jgi:hypothetical protein
MFEAMKIKLGQNMKNKINKQELSVGQQRSTILSA